MKDLIEIVCEGTMLAAAEIVDRAGIKDKVDVVQLSEALRTEIKNGYLTATSDAKQALEVLGMPMAKATLGASCRLFAARAIKACGYLEAGQ